MVEAANTRLRPNRYAAVVGSTEIHIASRFPPPVWDVGRGRLRLRVLANRLRRGWRACEPFTHTRLNGGNQ